MPIARYVTHLPNSCHLSLSPNCVPGTTVTFREFKIPKSQFQPAPPEQLS